MRFPKRYLNATPDGYPDIVIPLLANPTKRLLDDLMAPGYPDQAAYIAEMVAAHGEAATDAERAVYAAAVKGAEERQANRLRLGAALVEAYQGAKVDAYGATLDFSTPAAAVDTLFLNDLPDDLAYWLRNAPIEIASHIRNDLGKSLASSFAPGKP